MIIEVLKRVSQVLEEVEIPYMLSGSVALGLYTIARTTRDIDLVVELSVQDIDKFVAGFSDFFVDEVGIAEEVKRKGMFNIIDKSSAFKIDFIVRSDTTYGANEFKRRQLHTMDGINLWVVSLEDLIIAKLRWIQDFQSDRQMNDIRSLLLNPEIDWEYLNDWVSQLRLTTFNLLNHE